MSYKNKEDKNKRMKEYYIENKDWIRNKEKKFYQDNRERIITRSKKYYENNSEKVKEHNKKWIKNNLEKVRENLKKYAKTEKGKEIRKRHENKRERNLGFNPLNKIFGNSVAHHINRNDVIYIPKDIHKNISHCLETGRNMEKINKIAFNFM